MDSARNSAIRDLNQLGAIDSQSAIWEHRVSLDQATIRTIRAATHIQLMEHNPDHQDLYASYMALKGKYEQLNSSYNQLNDNLKNALSKPSQTQPDSSGFRQLPVLPKPNQSDYPGIRFWTQPQYTEWKKTKTEGNNVVNPMSSAPGTSSSTSYRHRGSAHLAQTGENVQTEFIEQEDGTVVDGRRAASIRDLARRLLLQMKKDGTELPGKWQQADIYQKGYVLQALYKEYPYLSLCENNWKANTIVSRVLSGEISKEKKKGKMKEPVTKPEPVSAGPSGSKRSASPCSPANQESPKRTKLYSISPLPSPLKIQMQPSTPTPGTPCGALTYPAAPQEAEIPPMPMTVIAGATQAAPSLSDISGFQEMQPALGRGDADISGDLVPRNIAERLIAEPEHGTIDDQSKSTEAHSRAPTPVVESSAAPPSVATKPLVLINPLVAVFGPEHVPSDRIDALHAKVKEKNEKGKKKGGRKKALKENIQPTTNKLSNDSCPAPASSTSSAPLPSLKRVTGSKSAKNLFYIDYLTTHETLTVEAFEDLWKTLSKDDIKKWTAAGKASRYVLEPIDDEEVNME